MCTANGLSAFHSRPQHGSWVESSLAEAIKIVSHGVRKIVIAARTESNSQGCSEAAGVLLKFGKTLGTHRRRYLEHKSFMLYSTETKLPPNFVPC
jgi:hypothetical protein